MVSDHAVSQLTVNLHNEVNAAHLIHELHAIGQHHSPTSLDFVALEDLPPFVFSVSPFQLNRIEDVFLLRRNFGMVGRAIPNFAKYLQRFLVTSVSIEPAGRLWKAEDQEDYDLM